MMALSAKFSTTWKFSIVAKGRGNKNPSVNKHRYQVNVINHMLADKHEKFKNQFLTFPVITDINIPEVVANFMPCYPFNSMGCFQRI